MNRLNLDESDHVVCGISGSRLWLSCSLYSLYIEYSKKQQQDFCCIFPVVGTNRTEPAMHESLLSACKAVPGICVVQSAAWPTKCFGKTELKREKTNNSFKPWCTLKKKACYFSPHQRDVSVDVNNPWGLFTGPLTTCDKKIFRQIEIQFGKTCFKHVGKTAAIWPTRMIFFIWTGCL